MKEVFKISVPSKPEYVSTVRLSLSSYASKNGFDIEQIEDIKVALSEACTNVIKHGVIDKQDYYDVICENFDDKAVFTVLDKAGGCNIATIKEPVIGELKEGGLGIFVMKSLMDNVEMESEQGIGTCIRLTKMKRAV